MNIEKSKHVTFEAKYLAPTNTKGARIKVFCKANKRSFTVSYDYGAGNAYIYAFETAFKMWKDCGFFPGWNPDFIAGETKDGMVFIAKNI